MSPMQRLPIENAGPKVLEEQREAPREHSQVPMVQTTTVWRSWKSQAMMRDKHMGTLFGS